VNVEPYGYSAPTTALGSGTVYFNGGTISSGTAGTPYFANAITIGTNATVTFGNNIGTSGAGNGGVWFQGNVTFNNGSTILTPSGGYAPGKTTLGGTGSLVTVGTGVVVAPVAGTSLQVGYTTSSNMSDSGHGFTMSGAGTLLVYEITPA